MSNLPVDLITDILSRVPVKQLLSFRSVSKPWCSLIDGPDFIKLHLNHSIKSNTNQTLILKDSDLYTVDAASLDSATELDHPLMCYNHSIKVLGSCNGLLCISNIVDDLAVWNHSTRKHHVLPFLSLEVRRYSGTLVCNVSVFGFGYDLVHDDYKVVRVAQFGGVDSQYFESEVKVCGLRTNTWRRIKDLDYVFHYPGTNGLYANGALHWVVSRRSEPDVANVVVAIDLGVEDFREMPQPDFADKNFKLGVGVLGACLCVIASYREVRAEVWVMKEYGVKESWTKLFSVEQQEVLGSLRRLRPLAYSKDGSEVLFEQDNTNLFCYDLKKKTARHVWIRNTPICYEAEICLRTLVPLNVNRRNDGGKAEEDKKNMKKRDDFLSEGFKLVL